MCEFAEEMLVKAALLRNDCKIGQLRSTTGFQLPPVKGKEEEEEGGEKFEGGGESKELNVSEQLVQPVGTSSFDGDEDMPPLEEVELNELQLVQPIGTSASSDGDEKMPPLEEEEEEEEKEEGGGGGGQRIYRRLGEATVYAD